jgi:Mrp family chromosome partitioning ATPase
LIADRQTPGPVRKAIAEARKAMREPEAIRAALENLRDALSAQVAEARVPDTAQNESFPDARVRAVDSGTPGQARSGFADRHEIVTKK